MALGTVGWHSPGPAGLCSALGARGHRDPPAICYLAVTSVFSHCPQMRRQRQSLPAALLQGGIFLERKINLLEEIP